MFFIKSFGAGSFVAMFACCKKLLSVGMNIFLFKNAIILFMKSVFAMLLATLILTTQLAYSQKSGIDKVQFFKDETSVNVTLESYWTKVFNQKNKEGRVFPARFISKINDSLDVNEPVNLTVRGHFRRDYCVIPPLKLSFSKTTDSKMHALKSIKLVSSCRPNGTYEQFLLKEYLIYKIYNLLTEKSFWVRLLKVDYKDSNGNKSNFIEPAFFTEDLKDMAKRNKCIEWKKGKLSTESTNRKQMTMVAVFEFMIGNTDWSVPGDHNIVLIQSKDDSTSVPFAVPYDFDYSGLVNTEYAVPDPLLNTEQVQERVYRGYARTMEELNETLEIFEQQKDKIYALINNFEPLTSRNKKGMISYLEEFYKIIRNPKEVKYNFIDKARID